MYTLGVNAAFHDPAAALVRDGQLVAAAEDERFTHIKHGKRPVPFTVWELPFHAIEYCLRQANITLAEVDHVAYSFDPKSIPGMRTTGDSIALPLRPAETQPTDPNGSAWDPLFYCYLINAPAQLRDGAPHHLAARFKSTGQPRWRWHWVKHHLAHAASAYLASPFERSAVMTLDGRGERATTTYGIAEGVNLEIIGQVDMPHSLGILYEQVTDYLGFLHSSDEYKVMALASFGEPRYVDHFRQIISVGAGGQYTIAPPRLAERFGPGRQRGAEFEAKHYDIARSLQVVLEDTVVELGRWLHGQTGAENLCMAGGVALNCVMNSRLRDRGPFKQIWVQPAAGDAGTALGAALWVDARERGIARREWEMNHALWGPEFTDEQIEEFLVWCKLPYRRLQNVAEETADILAADKVIGWFQGRMEFGPRALGARSILASPISPSMQARLNEIKDREDFRPVAPVVIEEEAERWFERSHRAPFMLFIFDVKPQCADKIPAVRHVDGTARVQTVNRSQHPLYYDLLRAFQQRTGVPVLVNTSFNTRGEPIVCTPRDAIESYLTSPLDALVIGSFVLEKNRL